MIEARGLFWEAGKGVTSTGLESFRRENIIRVVWPYLFIMPGPRRVPRQSAPGSCRLSAPIMHERPSNGIEQGFRRHPPIFQSKRRVRPPPFAEGPIDRARRSSIRTWKIGDISAVQTAQSIVRPCGSSGSGAVEMIEDF